MIRYDLTIATRFIHLGLNYRYEGRRGQEVDWVHDPTNQRLTLTDEQIAELVAEEGARLVCTTGHAKDPAIPEPVVDLESLSAEELAALQRRWEYAQDLSKAVPPWRAPIKDVEATVLTTARRLQDPHPPCWRTVRRWQARLGDHPHIGRLIERHRDKGNHLDRLHPEVREVVERLIDQRYLARPPISMITLQAFIRTEIRQLNVHRSAEDKLETPGFDAIASAIAARNPREVHAARHGEVDAAQKYDGVDLREDPEAPLDLVELDHTIADLFVVSNELRVPIGRPTIAIAVDRCTRMPFGIYIGFEHPSVLTVMQCLKNGILPKTYLRRKVEAGEWKIQNHWPVFGVPRGLLFDRAMENLGHDIRLNAAGLGIANVLFAPRRTPRHKGGVERFFGTLNKRLLHEQRGTTFSNVLQRKDYDSQKNAIITLDELYEQAHRFLVDIYPRKRHAGIRDLPYRRWDELTERFRIDPLGDLQEILPLFGRTFYATLQRAGVQLKHIVYNSPELAALRSSPAFRAKAELKPRLAFRYDPADLGAIHVYLPHEKRFLEVKPVSKWLNYAEGLSMWEHLSILRYERERCKGATDPDSLAEAMVALIVQMEAADGRRRTSKVSKRLARLTGHGRISPAGDTYATTPVNSTAGRHARRFTPSNDQEPLSHTAARPAVRRRVRIISATEPDEA